MARLKQFYREKVIAQLIEQFGYKSSMQVPRITKITLNMGLGEALVDKKVLEHGTGDMTKISGQKPIITYARKSVAGFKVREGWPIGCKVTLRSERMYEFLDRLINIAIEQIMFAEIDYDRIDALRGMDITITTDARTDEEGRALLAAFNFPFRN